MAPPVALDHTAMTPLAPSVEKAYYRKCIQLKRRLNEVEAANDEAKLRRVRLDRAIMKMRLERAFLLDELRKRMDQNVDGSEGSGEEGMATPPPDRPHRDKRRRPQPSQAPGSAAAPVSSFQSTTYGLPQQRTASGSNVGANVPMNLGPGGRTAAANAVIEDGEYSYADGAQQGQQAQASPTALPHGSPYGPPPTGVSSAPGTNGMDVDSVNGREVRPKSREAGATGELMGAGSTVVEENGGRRGTPENASLASGNA